jgi:hypothetical protein
MFRGFVASDTQMKTTRLATIQNSLFAAIGWTQAKALCVFPIAHPTRMRTETLSSGTRAGSLSHGPSANLACRSAPGNMGNGWLRTSVSAHLPCSALKKQNRASSRSFVNRAKASSPGKLRRLACQCHASRTGLDWTGQGRALCRLILMRVEFECDRRRSSTCRLPRLFTIYAG